MRRYLLLGLGMLVGLAVKAQVNLVPNPSFEDFSDCPFSTSSLNYAIGWINPTGYSPDYFNACDTGMFAGVPKNSFGIQSAKTGYAYAGIITMIETDSREYIQSQLTDQLLANYTYEVSFYVSPADVSTYVSNDVGAYFSAAPIHSIPANSLLYLPYTPQVQNNPITNPLNARDTWIKVSETFTASGGEQYITIGNFKDDASTDTVHYPTIPTPSFFHASYHYIDDVSVVCLDCPVGMLNVIDNGSISIYPNPASDWVNVDWRSVSPVKITLLNSIGIPVLVKIQSSTSLQIDVTQYPSGVYFLKAEANDYSLVKTLFIKH